MFSGRQGPHFAFAFALVLAPLDALVHYVNNAHMTGPSFQFEIQPSSGLPIFRQIMDQVRAMVSSGQLAQGEMLPSIRSLATELEVNMMTVSKAYGRLEAEGILERVRGTGMRVRDASPQGSLAERRAELVPLIESMLTRAQQLDLSEPQIIAAVRGVLKERKTWQKT